MIAVLREGDPTYWERTLLLSSMVSYPEGYVIRDSRWSLNVSLQSTRVTWQAGANFNRMIFHATGGQSIRRNRMPWLQRALRASTLQEQQCTIGRVQAQRARAGHHGLSLLVQRMWTAMDRVIEYMHVLPLVRPNRGS